MQSPAAKSDSSSNTKCSKLDWLTPDLIRSAHRARSKVMHDMATRLGHRLWAIITASLTSSGRSRHNDFGRHIRR
jgi:hypothetical protein